MTEHTHLETLGAEYVPGAGQGSGGIKKNHGFDSSVDASLPLEMQRARTKPPTVTTLCWCSYGVASQSLFGIIRSYSKITS